MDLTQNTVALVVLGTVALNVGIVVLVGAREALSWSRNRRARRMEEAFGAGSFTVPTAWVREARRERGGPPSSPSGSARTRDRS